MSDIISTPQRPAFINYFAAIFAATGSLLFGYDSGIIGSVISPAYKEFIQYYGAPGPNLTGAIVSVFAGGAFFGALLAGYAADKIGRKRTLQLGSIVAIIGCVIQTGAPNVAALIAGRLIAGFAIGILTMIVPMYQAEISPPHVRGLLSGTTQLGVSFGFFIANWVGYGCGFLSTQAQFRVPLALQNVPAIVLLVGMFFLPDSPRWLAQQGRTEDARATIVRLHGGAQRADLDNVEVELQDMLVQIQWEDEHLSHRIQDLFNSRPNLRRTICGVLVQAISQWTGVNVAAYFGPTIYANLGFSGQQQLLINGLYGAWGLPCTFAFITLVVDRLGRRKPLMLGPIFMGACLAWQAGIGKVFADKNGNYGLGIAGVASFFCFKLGYAFSYGPVSWIYQSEIFPMHLRAMGTAASTASNWLNNVIIAQITPIGLASLGWKYFMIFVSTNVGGSILAYLLFPETKGKTLEEVGALFGDENIQERPSDLAFPAKMQKSEKAEEIETV